MCMQNGTTPQNRGRVCGSGCEVLGSTPDKMRCLANRSERFQTQFDRVGKVRSRPLQFRSDSVALKFVPVTAIAGAVELEFVVFKFTKQFAVFTVHAPGLRTVVEAAGIICQAIEKVYLRVGERM